MTQQRGFTLIELMTTLVIAVLLVTIAIPSFRDIFIRNRLTLYANEFIAAIHYARSESVKRGQSVILCKSSSGTGCTTSGSQWENGWIAFVDTNANGSLDTDETLLRVWPALPSPYTLRPNNNFTNFVRYDTSGAATNLGTFAVCYDSNEKRSKAIVITRLRPRLGADKFDKDCKPEPDDIPEKDSGPCANGTNIGSCENP